MSALVGQTVSHYRILERLGGGGMGVVYKAQDLKLDRLVALKFLPPELTRDLEAKRRFVHEAKAASTLQHTNICVVHDIDEAPAAPDSAGGSAAGQMFICMEYLEGETLKRKIERCPLRIDEAIDVAIQVAGGLTKAHEHGIIHRDIKPANVMFTTDGVAKIVDFGLAKLSGPSVLTTAGSTLGTTGYMSPEQARGEATDDRTDIWSLGVVLYEMLTGLRPFRGDYEQAILFQIMNEAPEAVTGLRTGTPAELERIVNKCLEKNRDERYQTTADLIADLRHLKRTMDAGDASSQRSMGAVLAAPQKRKWWPWAAAFLLLAVIVTVALISTPRREAAPEDTSIAVLPFIDMSPQKDQEYFCDGMTDELINRLSKIRDLRVPARTSAFMFKGKTEDIREIGSKLNVQKLLEGSVRKSGDRLRVTAQLINVADGYHLWSETYERKLEDVFAIQDEISSAIVNALRLSLTSQEMRALSEHPIDNVRAYDCYLRAYRQIMRYDRESLDSAIAYLQTALDIMGDNAQLYSGMAAAHSMYANIGVGQEEYLRRAEEYAMKALTLQPGLPSALGDLSSLAIYKDYPRNLQDAFRYSREALAESSFDAKAIHGLSQTYLFIGKPSEALKVARILERHDPLNPRLRLVRGFCYLYDCQFSPALEDLRAYYHADSTSPLGQTVYSTALVYSGKRDEALAVIARMERATAGNETDGTHSTFPVFSLLLKYALLKDRESAMRAMTPDFQMTCRRDLEWSYWVANRLSLLGAREEALDWLENAVSRGFINLPYLRCDPLLDNIRGEPRFARLMEWVKHESEHFEVPE